MCREDNFRLVPKILDHVDVLHTLLIKEIDENSKPFSHLNNGQSTDNTIKSTPRKRSNFIIYYFYNKLYTQFIINLKYPVIFTIYIFNRFYVKNL